MPYLILNDYIKQIQQAQLTQLTGGNDSLRLSDELAAQEEISSNLRQKYDISGVFTETAAWSYTTAYSGGARVYLDADPYSTLTSYAVHNLTLQANKVYICTATTTGAFDITKWTLLGAQYAMFFTKYPNNVFDLNGVYSIGDVVYYNGRTYRALKQSYDNTVTIQQGTYSNTAPRNAFPDAVNGNQYWQDLGAYTVSAGTLPTDATKWVVGDNRNQQMVMFMIDIALYHLHCRIAPQNVPAHRHDRYCMAKEWLKSASRGEITADLPLIQPKQGSRIRWGGNIRNINSY